MDARQLKGLAVVSLAEAERLGRVDDVVFETAPIRAAGLRLRTDSGSRFIGLSDVRSVGSDAITADSAVTTAAMDASLARDGLPGLDDLGRRKVVDEEGSFVGQIARIDIDTSTGVVSGVDVRKGEVLGMGGDTRTIRPDEIITVGSELITVRRSPEANQRRAAPDERREA